MSHRTFPIWSPDRRGFPEHDRVAQMRFLLRFAILAPSGHNAQPWRYEIDEQVPALQIHLDEARVLRVSDPTDRVTHMALGTTTRHFVRAAESYGLVATPTIVDKDGECYVSIELDEAPADTDSDSNSSTSTIDWLDAITHRLANRYDYLPDPLDPEQIARLVDFAIPGTEVRTFTAQADRDTIADLTAGSSKRLINDRAFRGELAGYVHNNWSQATTGIPAHNLGVPDVPSLIAPFLVRHAPVGTWFSRRDRRMLATSPLLVAVMTPGDTPRDWISSGMAHDEIWLRATAEGLGFDTYAAATDEAPTRATLAERLGLDGYPQILFRVGKPKKANDDVTHCGRLPVEDVLA